MAIALDIFRGRRAAVLGLGRSGLATARALAAGGAEALCWDDSEAGRRQAEAEGFTLADPAVEGAFDGLAALIPAPGIPFTHPAPHPAIVKARAAGVPILGDVELLGRQQTDAHFIGITGTNGKSTTTALIGHMLDTAGRPVAVGGNLGTAALALEPFGANGTYVLEMSSYQLDLIETLAFDVAVFLNVTPDHLDRHGGMDGYVLAKKRIFRNTKPGAVAVIAVDDAISRAVAEEVEAAGTHRVVRVSVDPEASADVRVDADGRLIDADGTAVIDLTECPTLPGRHNFQNAAAAFAAARALNLSTEQAVAGLKSFPGLPHRQERIATIDGHLYVNDSKATNIEAAAKALASYERIYWIAGGRAKEGGFAALIPALGAVRHAFLIGEAAKPMAEALAHHIPTTVSGDLATAVDQASTLAGEDGGAGDGEGGVILLSPACASFDQFRDFEARGDAFRALVDERAARHGGGA